GDCADADPCTTGERCDPASRVCASTTLDGDRDSHPPRVCGGDDCDDGNAQVFAGAREACNLRDDDCDGVVDNGAGLCPAGEVCRAGACACDGARQRCGGACVDVTTSATDCGRCGAPCMAGAACVAGACQCAAGRATCGTSCPDLQTDALHCGGCGRACAPNETCVAGVCGCPAGASCGEQCAGLTVIDSARVGTRTGNVLRVTGNTAAAWAAQNPGGVLAARSPVAPMGGTVCPRSVGQVIYRYVSTAANVALRITTTNAGTAPGFDTVLYLATSCAATLTGNACNDDDVEVVASGAVTSLVTADFQPAGTAYYIVVGGLAPPVPGTLDRGAFELTIAEIPAIAPGAPCNQTIRTGRCGAGYACTGPLDSVQATCVALGSAAGAVCRAATPQCDAGLTCETIVGSDQRCVTTVTAGASCDVYRRCPTNTVCRPLNVGSTRGVCVATGSYAGGPCRAPSSPSGQCDSGMTCGTAQASAVVPSPTPVCRVPSVAGGACSILRTQCPDQYTCLSPDSYVGACRAAGTAALAPCRASAPTCDASLSCVATTIGSVCLGSAGAGAVCGYATACQSGSSCVIGDLSDRSHGICGVEGSPGGLCHATGTRCDGGALCSTATGTGVCYAVVGAGQSCHSPSARCVAGTRCVLVAGSSVEGACRAPGTAPGASCNPDGTCAAGLVCSSPARGLCQTPVTAACDPLGGTTRCPSGQVCVASASTAGRCATPTGAEVEPNDSPALVAARAVSAPSAFRGALAFGDVDCVAVRVPAGGAVVAFVSDGNGRCPVAPGGAIALDLFDPDGVNLRSNTLDTGPDRCAHIDGARRSAFPSAGALAAGTYTVCARPPSGTTLETGAVPTYVLTVAATP
ncbi:MAG: hypothetical protein JWM10_3380, partial [Myxococcaceae bacterium]|nr:hypothetical protein [Myxococcaceae bacterium]